MDAGRDRVRVRHAIRSSWAPSGRRKAWIKAHYGRRLLYATPEQLTAFLARYDQPRTRNSYLADIRSFYRFALEKGYRAKDPSAGLRRFREPRLLPRPLKPDEVVRLRHAAATLSLRHRVIVDLALHAGPRRMEIGTLRWENIDLDRREIRVYGKGSKERVIPMHAGLVALLHLWRLSEPGSDYVFPSQKGGHLRLASVWRFVKEAGEVGCVEVTTHRLRHTFATALLDEGVDIRVIQELLGHASLTSTQIYAKVSPKGLREAVAKLDYDRRDDGESIADRAAI